MKKLIFTLATIVILTLSVAGQRKMLYNVTPIIENLSPYAWYPLNNVTEATFAEFVSDASGNGRGLEATNISPDTPSYVLDVINGLPVVRHNADSPLLYDPTGAGPTVKHLFILTKYTAAANFGAGDRGFISEQQSAGSGGKALFVGDSGQTYFVNQSITGFTYFKSQTSYAEGNQQAPFTNFELIEFSSSTGLALDDLLVGQDRDDSASRWYGDWADLIIFTSELDADQLRGVRLYFDLKYNLWLTHSTTLYFPDQAATGILWSRFDEEPLPWDNVTISNEYDDGGRSFNTITDDPTKFWTIEFTGLTPEEAEIFDVFNDAARRDRTFSLVDKYGTTHTGVRILDYSRSHEGHKSWSKDVSFRLAKYPG